ncbi:hypothetical protein [Streptomyces fungicidicus]|uniref:hypothetical protein n=1 Tax=Streptomyces fungicidicus TaxID=68203 RepID=UPI003D71E19E
MEIFLDKKSTDLRKFLEVLHIDTKNSFGVSIYDADNQLLIERSSDFSTTESEKSKDLSNSQDEFDFKFDDITNSDNA